MNIESIKSDVNKLNTGIVEQRKKQIIKTFIKVFDKEPIEIIMVEDKIGHMYLYDDMFIKCDMSYGDWVVFELHKAVNGEDARFIILENYNDLVLSILNKNNNTMEQTESLKSLSEISKDVKKILLAEPHSLFGRKYFDIEEDEYVKGSFKLYHQAEPDVEHSREGLYYEYKTINGNRYGMGLQMIAGSYETKPKHVKNKE